MEVTRYGRANRILPADRNDIALERHPAHKRTGRVLHGGSGIVNDSQRAIRVMGLREIARLFQYCGHRKRVELACVLGMPDAGSPQTLRGNDPANTWDGRIVKERERQGHASSLYVACTGIFAAIRALIS